MWKLSVGRKYLEMKDISLTLHNLFSIQIIKFEKWAPKKITSWCKRRPSNEDVEVEQDKDYNEEDNKDKDDEINPILPRNRI